MALRAALTVHDVAPETLPNVTRLAEQFIPRGSPALFAVIPGRNWQAPEIETLRGLVEAGWELALHGWDHTARRPSNPWERIHSAVFSKGCAEHLGLTEAEIVERAGRGLAWFGEAGLPPPRWYVPPAWELGALRPRALRGTSIRYIEGLAGIHDVASGRHRRLPLVGFEARGWLQAAGLTATNAVSQLAARVSGRGVRIAIHPYDLELLLGNRAHRLLKGASRDLVRIEDM